MAQLTAPPPTLFGREGTIQRLLEQLKLEDLALDEAERHGDSVVAAASLRAGAGVDDGLPLMPLTELLDMAHRCIDTLQQGVVNPAIPPPMRDRGLSILSRVVQLLRSILRRRIGLLAAWMVDPAYDVASLRRDVEAACDSPQYYCFVDASIRRSIRYARRDPPPTAEPPPPESVAARERVLQLREGPNTLVSNLLTLALDLAPFDAVWLTVGAAGGFRRLRFGHVPNPVAVPAGAAGEDDNAPSEAAQRVLERLLAQAEWLRSETVFFAVPPPAPLEPSGMVVGGIDDPLSRKARRWERLARERNIPMPGHPGRDGSLIDFVEDEVPSALAMDDSPFASPTTGGPAQSSAAAQRGVALPMPPVASEAPLIARAGAVAVVRALHLGVSLDDPAASPVATDSPSESQDEWQPFRSMLRRHDGDVPADSAENRQAIAMVNRPSFVPTSARSRAVAALLTQLEQRSGTAERPAETPGDARAPDRKSARTEAQSTAVSRPPHKRRIGFGIRGLSDDSHVVMLEFLPPRGLRSVQATCRRMAWFINRSPSLQATCSLSRELGRRIEWFFEDEWGERMATLATLPVRPRPAQPAQGQQADTGTA